MRVAMRKSRIASQRFDEPVDAPRDAVHYGGTHSVAAICKASDLSGAPENTVAPYALAIVRAATNRFRRLLAHPAVQGKETSAADLGVYRIASYRCSSRA